MLGGRNCACCIRIVAGTEDAFEECVSQTVGGCIVFAIYMMIMAGIFTVGFTVVYFFAAGNAIHSHALILNDTHF